MRIEREIPKEHDRRTVQWFALLPVTIRETPTREVTRWLEWVTVEQEYRLSWDDFWSWLSSWKNIRFVDGE